MLNTFVDYKSTRWSYRPGLGRFDIFRKPSFLPRRRKSLGLGVESRRGRDGRGLSSVEQVRVNTCTFPSPSLRPPFFRQDGVAKGGDGVTSRPLNNMDFSFTAEYTSVFTISLRCRSTEPSGSLDHFKTSDRSLRRSPSSLTEEGSLIIREHKHDSKNTKLQKNVHTNMILGVLVGHVIYRDHNKRDKKSTVLTPDFLKIFNWFQYFHYLPI